MTEKQLSQDDLKRMAGEYAVCYVTSGMVVGLGHGSTAIHAIRKIAALLKSEELQNIRCIPCSDEVARTAERLCIPLTTLEAHPVIDVTIDGADEVDPEGNVIKGGGGALVREKIVAQATRREIIVVDESKLSPVLGTQWAVPVAVVPFGWSSQTAYLRGLGAEVTLRTAPDGEPVTTDEGNLLLDCDFGPIEDLAALDRAMTARAGIVGHGLFFGLVSDVVIAGPGGVVCRPVPIQCT
ncbi:MAG: ribose-5-phosphate isomerase RpiA [Anaerolineae bacterium]|nr:ribose-5-phosphate isomerase RpiA [Anaerolineae bacterium]